MAIKFCVKCGSKFDAVGREVICPACKATAAEEARHAAVLRAKKASWTGESVPVRISGRASTVIRKYGEENNMPFAQALDKLLQSTPFFVNLDIEWSTIVPYKSRRMKKGTDTAQEAPQAASKPQEVTKAAKVTSKTNTASKTAKATKAAQDKEEAFMKQIKKAVIASKSKTAGRRIS